MRPRAWRPWLRAALVAGGLLILLWLGAVARAGFGAADDLDSGRDQINDAKASLSLEAIVDGSAARDLRAASTHFAAAKDKLRSPILAPGRYLPILGRQLRSVSTMSGTASELLNDGAELSEDLGRVDTKTSAGRLAALDLLSSRAVEFEEEVTKADLGPRAGLLGQLRKTRVEVEGRGIL